MQIVQCHPFYVVSYIIVVWVFCCVILLMMLSCSCDIRLIIALSRVNDGWGRRINYAAVSALIE